MSTIGTRAKTPFKVFGHGRELSKTVLPTCEDVMRFYLLLQNKTELERGGQHPSVSEIAEKVAIELEQIWRKASIPVVSQKRVVQKIRQYNDKYRGYIKHYKERQNRVSYKAQLKTFKDESKQLFDLAACKCDFNDCKCDKVYCVPVEEQKFLTDQRSLRVMFIGPVDISATNIMKRKLARRLKGDTTQRNAMKTFSQSVTQQREDHETASSEVSISDSDNDFQPHKVTCSEASTSCLPKKVVTQNRLVLPSLQKYLIDTEYQIERLQHWHHLCWKMLA